MSTRFERSGVGEPQIATYILDDHFRRIQPGDAAYIEGQAIRDDICDYAELQEVVTKLNIDKPRWYEDLERDARSYMQAQGFPDLPPLFLLSEGKELAQIGMLDEHGAYAQTTPFNQFAVVREAKMREAVATEGALKATSVLVHELAHLTLQHMAVTVYPTKKRNFHDDYVTVRAGMFFISMDKFRGKFFEEGFASYVAGCSVRAASGDMSATAMGHKPAAYVPEWYRFADNGLDPFGGETTMGPDGYAFEMMAWAAEDAGHMTAEDFRRTLLDSRRKRTQVRATRMLVRTMNLIEPNLYGDLSKIQYDKEGSIEGCARVYEAITGELWPDIQETTYD